MNSITRIATTTLLSACALQASAQVQFGISANTGRMDYTIESSTQQRWSGDGRLLSLSADIGSAGGLYGSVSHTRSASGKLEFTFQGGGSRPQYEFDRSDSALTIGWAAANRLNTFVGVKSAQTKIKNAIGTEFNTTGYFVGLSYPISMGSATLALTGAVGVNTGKWKDTGGTAKDSAFGASGGLKLAYAFTPMIVATAGLKAQRYSYDFKATLGKEVDESVRSLELGLSFNF